MDIAKVRASFAPLTSGVAYFENAGRSFEADEVARAHAAFVAGHPVQPAYPHRLAQRSHDAVAAGVRAACDLFGCDPEELVLGHSTTMNVFVLAAALRSRMRSGDAIVVSEQDHEANAGAWRRWAETGVKVRVWKVREDGALALEDLDRLLDEKVRLVCFPHVSNVLGTIQDVPEITRRAHAVGAQVCVDGVAFAPHRLLDVRAWGVDYYLFSLYKVYGPHLGALYVKRSHLEALPNQSHYFHREVLTKKLAPGGLQYDLVSSVAGVGEYLDAMAPGEGERRTRWAALFEDVAAHEESLASRILEFLSGRGRVLGEARPDRELRVPTISVAVEEPRRVAEALAERDVAVGVGHFYAPRLLEAMGIDAERGVLRMSAVHYNDDSDVDRLLEALDAVL